MRGSSSWALPLAAGILLLATGASATCVPGELLQPPRGASRAAMGGRDAGSGARRGPGGPACAPRAFSPLRRARPSRDPPTTPTLPPPPPHPTPPHPPPPHPTPRAGVLQLGLYDTTNGATTAFAKCWSQASVEVWDDCTVKVSPLANANVYINTLWTPVAIYSDYQAW